MTGCLTDGRVSTRVAHTLRELIAQRVFGIACGYPNANDADRLADDPMQKLLLDGDPIAGPRWRRSRRSLALRMA